MNFASYDNLVNLLPLLANKISSGGGIKVWAANTSYVVDEIVLYGNSLYKCTTAHTSTSTFDSTKWQGLSFTEWATNTSYNVGDIIYYEGQLYKVTTAFTSGTTFSDTNLELYLPYGLSSQTVQNLIDNFNPGGSGVNAIIDTLWDNPNGNQITAGDTLTLTHPYTDYDYILINKFYSGYNTILIGANGIIGPSLCFTEAGSLVYSLQFSQSSTPTQLVVQDATSGYGTGTIRKIEGIKFLNPNVYSTSEQRIGTWIDGKPLYQCTFSGTTGTMANPGDFDRVVTTHANLTSFNIDKVAKFDYVLQSANDTATSSTMFSVINNNTVCMKGYNAIYLNLENTTEITSDVGKWFMDKPFVVTIQYTKTTD